MKAGHLTQMNRPWWFAPQIARVNTCLSREGKVQNENPVLSCTPLSAVPSGYPFPNFLFGRSGPKISPGNPRTWPRCTHSPTIPPWQQPFTADQADQGLGGRCGWYSQIPTSVVGLRSPETISLFRISWHACNPRPHPLHMINRRVFCTHRCRFIPPPLPERVAIFFFLALAGCDTAELQPPNLSLFYPLFLAPPAMAHCGSSPYLNPTCPLDVLLGESAARDSWTYPAHQCLPAQAVSLAIRTDGPAAAHDPTTSPASETKQCEYELHCPYYGGASLDLPKFRLVQWFTEYDPGSQVLISAH